MKVLTVFGTRPEAIKMAPLVEMLNEDKDIESVLAVTAQHREMLDQAMSLFNMKPDHDLDIMEKNQMIEQITSRVMIGVSEIIKKESPDIILVHGDTTTTFASALAAFNNKIKIGHVEAGLRSYDRYSPFPEEMNRVLTDHLSDLHFAPTALNKENLIKEGIPKDKIYVTGNTVIDTLLKVSELDYEFEDEVLRQIDFNRKIITLTCHRRENLGDNMENIFRALLRITSDFPDTTVIYPVHLNPKVQKYADEILKNNERIHLIPPLSYQQFVNLLKNSYLIVTDSGGIQEEAPSLGKPVLLARSGTERPDAIKAGTIKSVSVEESLIYNNIRNLLLNAEGYNKMARAVNPYGDGFASKRIIKILKERV